MWKISEVKQKGLTRFKANYWMCVLVAVIVALISGGIGGGFRFGGSNFSNSINKDRDKNDRFERDFDRDVDDFFDGDRDYDYDNDYDNDYDYDYEDDHDHGFNFGSGVGLAAGIAVFAIFAVIFVIIFVIATAVDIFLINPVKLGCDKFFLKNLEENSSLSPLGAAFGPDYKNIVKVLFFKDLFLFLWAIIPIAGIVLVIIKGYEYMMIPYLLAENPELSKDEAFELSKEMMHGQKWSAFGLDLSFIGWILLTIITFGILGIFYVSPYIYSTHAALYDTLKEETGVVSA